MHRHVGHGDGGRRAPAAGLGHGEGGATPRRARQLPRLLLLQHVLRRTRAGRHVRAAEVARARIGVRARPDDLQVDQGRTAETNDSETPWRVVLFVKVTSGFRRNSTKKTWKGAFFGKPGSEESYLIMVANLKCGAALMQHTTADSFVHEWEKVYSVKDLFLTIVIVPFLVTSRLYLPQSALQQHKASPRGKTKRRKVEISDTYKFAVTEVHLKNTYIT